MVHSLNQQLQEEAQTFAKQAKEQSEILVEQVKEGSQITEQTKEKLDPVLEKNMGVPPTPSSSSKNHKETADPITPEDDDDPWI